jgi:F-type H+-transporting ATPase subunit b
MLHRRPYILTFCVLAGAALLLVDPALAADPAAIPPGAHDAVPHDDHYGEAETSLLAFDLGSYIWKLIIFGVFFLLLAKFVWPPILKGLQDREAKQRTDLQNAERAAHEATATLTEYKQQLAEARKEAQGMIDQARTDADKAGAARKAEFEREVAQMRERTTREIAAAKETALADIYEQAAVLSTQIAGQILKRELNPQDQQGLVAESLQQIQSDARRN